METRFRKCLWCRTAFKWCSKNMEFFI